MEPEPGRLALGGMPAHRASADRWRMDNRHRNRASESADLLMLPLSNALSAVRGERQPRAVQRLPLIRLVAAGVLVPTEQHGRNHRREHEGMSANHDRVT